MAKRFAIRMQNDGVASAITDDRVVASVQNELLSLVFLNEVFDRLVNLRRRAPQPFGFHGNLLLGWIQRRLDSLSSESTSGVLTDWGP